MTPSEALLLAEKHVDREMIVLADTIRETEFGFYFNVTSERYLKSLDIMDLPVGSCGVMVDRKTGEVHDLGSAFGVDYWLEAYDRGLHLPMDVIVTYVGDRQRAASALRRLQMTYVIPEVAYGETWTIPRHFTQKDFVQSFDSLPVRFEAQCLIFRMHDLNCIAKDGDIKITLEPYKTG
jgi:Immunity protein 35